MIIAIDTGGTKTLICAFTKYGKMDQIAHFPTPTDPKEYVAVLKDQLRSKFKPNQVDLIVLALPGIIKGNVATWCQNLRWANFDVHKQLSDTLPGVKWLVENDANLGGLSEARALNPIARSSLYVTISTGIGSGYCLNGKIDEGLRLSEVGRILIEYRGKIKTWEETASGSAIVRTYRKMARDIKKPRVWRAIADRMSRGFISVIPMIQPDVIIIGGSIGTYFSRYSRDLKQLIADRLPEHIPMPKIVKAQYPELAVIYGCYYYGKDHLAGK